MSFFTKLKNRLFRSSSKISEGLDAIVADGGEEENPLNEISFLAVNSNPNRSIYKYMSLI